MDKGGKLLQQRYDLLITAHEMILASFGDPSQPVEVLIRQSASLGIAALKLRRAIGYRKWAAKKEALLGVYVCMWDALAAMDVATTSGSTKHLQEWKKVGTTHKQLLEKLEEAGTYLQKGLDPKNAGQVLHPVYYKSVERLQKERRMK